MPGAGFIGASAGRYRRRAGQSAKPAIKAAVLPASSQLVAGQRLSDTENWAAFTQAANYTTTTPGASIATVMVNYLGSTADADDILSDGDINAFSVTVTDTGGSIRTFTAMARSVQSTAPVAAGSLADRIFGIDTGPQVYDISDDFTGEGLVYSINTLSGVGIDSGTGVVSFDTAIMALQAGTEVVVTATNSGGAAQSSFSLTVADVPAQTPAPAVVANSPTRITVTLAVAPADNNAPITEYDLRYRVNGGSWVTQQDVSSPVVLDAFAARDVVDVQTRAQNAMGVAGWSVAGSVTTPFAAPVTTGDLADQSFSRNSGLRTYDASRAFAGDALTFVVTAVPGVSIDPATGVVSFDTNILPQQVDTDITVTASNPGGSAQRALRLTITAIPSTFSRVVFVGASIMGDINPITNLTERNTVFESEFAAAGAAVEVYANTTDGAVLSDTAAELAAAMAAFPSDTLFFVHTGGNDVSANRPYPGGADTISADLNALIDVAATRPGTVIISDLTFRDYDNTTAGNEDAGAKSYNDILCLPTFQARAGALVERAYYADGTPVSCLYEWTYYNRATYLSNDNVHPTPQGISSLQVWLAARLAPIITNGAVPAQATRLTLDDIAPILTTPSAQANGTGATSLGVTTNEGTGTLHWAIFPAATSPVAADVVTGTGATLAGAQAVTAIGGQSVADQTGLAAGTSYGAHYVHIDGAGNRSLVARSAVFETQPAGAALDIFIDYGNGTVPGVNTPAFSFPTTGLPGDGPFSLLNTDGSQTGVSLTLNFSAVSPGGTSGFGLNFSGRATDVPDFDGTLYNGQFTSDSYFVGAAYTLDHVIAGLDPNTEYTVEIVASRAASGSRDTLFTFAGGETATIATTANPVEAAAVVVTTSDAAGTITITQSALSGSWSYIGGLRISGNAAASLSVKTMGEEPVFATDVSGNLSVSIGSGIHAGTYTQRVTDGVALTVDMIAQASTPIALPVLSGTPQEGQVLTATPGLWLYDGPDPGDQRWAWINGTDGATGDTDLSYTIGAGDVGDRLKVTETVAGLSIESAETAPITAGTAPFPDRFEASDWSVTAGGTDTPNSLLITIASLPDDNGSVITDIEYEVDGNNTWTSLGISTATTTTIEMAAPQTDYDICLRAINSGGNADAGDTQSATSGAGVPNVVTDWAPSTGSGAAEIDITINTLPDDNGSAITNFEYEVDGSGSWASLGVVTATSGTVTLPASNVEYSIAVRAVNAVGNSTPSAPDVATSGVSAGVDPEADLTLTSTFAAGAIIGSGAVARNAPCVFAFDYSGLTNAQGGIWEQGASVIGAAVFFSSAGDFILRAGDGGSSLPNDNCGYLLIPAAQAMTLFSGEGTLVWEVTPGANTVRAWVNGTEIGTPVARTSGSGDWAGSDDGQFIGIRNSAVSGYPASAASYTTVSDLRYYENQTVS